jgi:lysophospholipase L1-like esterase
MKRLFWPLLMLLTSSSFAQTAKWDSTFRPNNYDLRVEQFRSYPNDPTDIVFLGNSITDYTDWNELLGLTTARNRGISGDITFGVLQRMDEVMEGKPAKVFILIGINDIARNIPDSVILDNYRKMIVSIKAVSPRTAIYFHTLLPVNNEFTARNHFNKDEHILYINKGIKELGVQEKITIIDLYPHFLNTDQKLDKKYTADGLHLNVAGYEVWARLLKPYLTN